MNDLTTTQNTSIFSSQEKFTLAGKMAETLARSTIVPKEFQGNACNTIIAIEMAERLHTSPLMIMQNLDVIYGRPAFRSAYLIGVINASGKYKTELQFELKGSASKGDLSCLAFAEAKDGHRVEGMTVTYAMAKAEGWVDKNGSKWKTMPELMIRYRAAAFFARLNCPELTLGIQTYEEVIDVEYREVGQANAEIYHANSVEFTQPEPIKNETVKADVVEPKKNEPEKSVFEQEG
jgi:hypothetical protein